ncbi:MAG: flagellar export chaperone FliS [Desulfobacterales bacterium]|nr:flagellar export chaperone FliS [Desulfobacterales bacterium]
MTMTNYNPYNQAVAQVTHNKQEILLLLLNGAQKFLNFARRGIKENKPNIRGENISKIIAIFTELDCALDKKIGGEMADNLSDLYRYMVMRLTEANVKNDISKVDEVEKLLKELKEGFEHAAKTTTKKSTVYANPQVQSHQSLNTGYNRKGICFAV